MSALTKSEMVDQLCDELEMSRRDAKDLVDLFFDEISNCLISGHAVKISGFGNFELKDKSARPGRNPRTGEEVSISARRVVTFRAGQKFRKLVEEQLDA